MRERTEDQKVKDAQRNAMKVAYKRLMENPDFIIFYNYLETCYNSYMDQGGAIELPKDHRDFVLAQSQAFYKILEHIKRQAKT